LIRDVLLRDGLALKYSEPAGRVVSRSGDDCVVALVDQWFLRYSDEEWKNSVRSYVNSADFETYHQSTKVDLERCVSWLNDWACSRSYGLGTKLPCDPKYLIESLSDSTIYMAYYAIAHILHGGSLDGKSGGEIAPGAAHGRGL
jgi:leucyl-tRNA synthetase